MKTTLRKSFVKDAVKLPPYIQKQLAEIISEIELAKELSEIVNCKKLKGFKTAFRIRWGQYRIGFYFENNTVELVRILQRKNIYKFFP